jgi:hypothetical protein
MVEIVRDVSESVCLCVPAVQDKDGASRVVGEIVHAGDEDATVRSLREKADSSQATGCNVDVEPVGQG